MRKTYLFMVVCISLSVIVCVSVLKLKNGFNSKNIQIKDQCLIKVSNDKERDRFKLCHNRCANYTIR